VQVHATKHLDAKTVAADRERYLAGSTAARGRQPSLGVGFDELLKSWVAVQRLHLKVPVTKERLLHHVKVILAGSGAKNRKGELYEDVIDLHWACSGPPRRRSRPSAPCTRKGGGKSRSWPRSSRTTATAPAARSTRTTSPR